MTLIIDPRTVVVMIPCYSGKIPAKTTGSLIQCGPQGFAAISIKEGVSHVALARNIIAESFLRSDFEWLVSLDDDIVFTPKDFSLLMEPSPEVDAVAQGSVPPTKIMCTQFETDFDKVGLRLDSPADALVCAEYSYKDDSLSPVRLGLGFTRIHRSVFEKIQNLKREDGESRAWQFIHGGKMLTDFYPSGPFVSQMVPGGEWKGEDHGFFTLCALAGIIPRIETRTRLFHVGTKEYPYIGDVSKFDEIMEGAQ